MGDFFGGNNNADNLWTTYFSTTDRSMAPPTKKSKTSHPHAVICCDQPCSEATIPCVDGYCHDVCPDFDQDTGINHNLDACIDTCQLQCLDHLHEQIDCHNDCSADCIDQCDLDCNEFCTFDCFEPCEHPETACMDECANWCTSHSLTDCLECQPSPAVSDVPTRQLSYSFEPFVANAATQMSVPPFPDRTLSQSKAVSLGGTDTHHVCKVRGCQAGSFLDEDTLQEHIEKSHLSKINGRYVCQWEGCVKKVTKKSNEHLEKEKQARANGITYIPSPEPFSDDHLHKLKRHYYVHSGKKAFECTFPECGSVHATKAQLKVHMARHNPKEFICPSCEKVFTTQNQLKTHVNAVHKREKQFKCPDCDYACDDSSNMSSHKRKQHLFGVPCPSALETGCTYRDGRQAEMEKHMHQHGHAERLLDNRDAFDATWKRDKKSADEELAGSRSAESRRSSTTTHNHHHAHDHTQGHRRHQSKIQHRKRTSTSTRVSLTLSVSGQQRENSAGLRDTSVVDSAYGEAPLHADTFILHSAV